MNNVEVRVSETGKLFLGNRRFDVIINDDFTFRLNKENPNFQTILKRGENKIIVFENIHVEEEVIQLKENETLILTINPTIKVLEIAFITIFTFLAILFILFILNGADQMDRLWILVIIPLFPFAIYLMNYKKGKEKFSLSLNKEKAIKEMA